MEIKNGGEYKKRSLSQVLDGGETAYLASETVATVAEGGNAESAAYGRTNSPANTAMKYTLRSVETKAPRQWLLGNNDGDKIYQQKQLRRDVASKRQYFT